MVICYLGIGSNLGDRNRNIKEAIKKINLLKDTQVIKISKIIETKPVGGPPAQGNFLNAALKIQTRISPLKLLKDLKEIEKDLGRTKTVKYGPRVIDLDILFYGDETYERQTYVIPHPRLQGRAFVLVPFCDLAPEFIHPGFKKSMKQLLEEYRVLHGGIFGVERTASGVFKDALAAV